MRGWKKIFHTNGNQKVAEVAILILDKIGFNIKTITQDIMIKGAIQKEDIITVNIYAPNIGTPQYIRQMLTTINRELDSNTIILGTLTPNLHQWTDHSDRKFIRKHKP